MPTIKLYNIVTNDIYELPVVCDIKGAQAAADYLGIHKSNLWRCMKADKWPGKYKAVYIGDYDKTIEVNETIIPLTKEERSAMLSRRHKMTRAEILKKRRRFYAENRERIKRESLDRYYRRKAENG